MTDRTAQIFEAAIQEFINTGDPVSSGLLYDRYDFGIKPAMIGLSLMSWKTGISGTAASFRGPRADKQWL